MFLSDGCITEGARFSFIQCIKQEEFTAKLAKDFEVKTFTRIQKGGYGDGKINISFRFSLKKLCPELLNGVDRKQKINDYLFENIGLRGLAFWYMGDGNLQTDHRTGTERMQVHTEGFEKPYLDKLVTWLCSKGYSCKLYDVSKYIISKHRPIGFLLRFDAAGTLNFARDISPYIREEFDYKLPLSHREHSYDYETPFIENGLNCYEIECKNIFQYDKINT